MDILILKAFVKHASSWDPGSLEAAAMPQHEFEALYNKLPHQILKREEQQKREKAKAQSSGAFAWLQKLLP